MSGSEVTAIYDAHLEEHKESWDKTRIIAYYSASGMREMPSIDKFMPFPWDVESKAVESDVKPNKDRMNHIIKMINGN